ncbi:hypothetical protein CS022_12310 [Veronia nyctiphanis]|uniref:ABC transporter n=1 Tax=Veronia nyctiphanis TaxID=1278244 RepID=A0A4V1LSV9_9GAMM|nr:hypothetical protein [Veronia nyctiphanis]RXJ73058.1 hypothetical protein CS022_12310 [Veronia nyctiphanis]
MQALIQMFRREWLEKKFISNVVVFFLALVLISTAALVWNADNNARLFPEMLDEETAAKRSLTLSEFIQTEGVCTIGDVKGGALTCGLGFAVFVPAIIAVVLIIQYFSLSFRKARSDGSAMFWAGMPVSSTKDHAVKLVFGLIGIPLMCSLIMLAISLGLWLFAMVLGTPDEFWPQELTFVGMMLNFPVYAFSLALSGVLLLPAAVVLMTMSQLFRHPVLVLVIGFIVIDLLSMLFLDIEVGGLILESMFMLSTQIFWNVYGDQTVPLGFTAYNMVLYVVLAAGGLASSLWLSRTVDVELFQRKARA